MMLKTFSCADAFSRPLLKHLLINNVNSMWFWIYCKKSPQGIYISQKITAGYISRQWLEFVSDVREKSGIFFLPTPWQPSHGSWTPGDRSQGINRYGIEQVIPEYSSFRIRRVKNAIILTVIMPWNWVHFCVLFNSLWSNDAICWQRSGSSLDQVMACCLTVPSHYLNHCGLIIT